MNPLPARRPADEVEELRAEVGELRQRLELLEARRPQVDDRTLAMLGVLAASVGIAAFSGTEAYRHARVIGGEVDEALDAAGIRSARQLGKRLQKALGVIVGDLQLQRIGRDRQGAIWAFVRVRI